MVKVSGELDLLTAPRFREALDEAVAGALAEGSPGVIVVDLGGVSFMDSSGINAIVGAARRLEEGGGGMRLVVKTAPVARTIELTGLNRIFEVFPDVGSAACCGVA